VVEGWSYRIHHAITITRSLNHFLPRRSIFCGTFRRFHSEQAQNFAAWPLASTVPFGLAHGAAPLQFGLSSRRLLAVRSPPSPRFKNDLTTSLPLPEYQEGEIQRRLTQINSISSLREPACPLLEYMEGEFQSKLIQFLICVNLR